MAATRKCDYCKGNINVRNKASLDHILRYKNKYYHTDCFITLAKSRVAENNSRSAVWQEALDNIDQLIADAKQQITNKVNKNTDALNEYLLLNYDVSVLSSRFWSVVADIGNGVYRHKRCKPIDCDTLLDMWKWGQRKLNQSDVWNKSHGKVIEGESRVLYDLAILMTKYNLYLKHKVKETIVMAEAKEKEETTKINYSKLNVPASQNTEEDIYNLLDEVF